MGGLSRPPKPAGAPVEEGAVALPTVSAQPHKRPQR